MFEDAIKDQLSAKGKYLLLFHRSFASTFFHSPGNVNISRDGSSEDLAFVNKWPMPSLPLPIVLFRDIFNVLFALEV